MSSGFDLAPIFCLHLPMPWLISGRQQLPACSILTTCNPSRKALAFILASLCLICLFSSGTVTCPFLKQSLWSGEGDVLLVWGWACVQLWSQGRSQLSHGAREWEWGQESSLERIGMLLLSVGWQEEPMLRTFIKRFLCHFCAELCLRDRELHRWICHSPSSERSLYSNGGLAV